jgi:hypothetical protein
MRDKGGKISTQHVAVIVLLLLSCSFISLGIVQLIKGDERELSERPSCVTLPVYSSFIEQVMGINPSWSSLRSFRNGFESTWRIETQGTTHRLTAILTEDECICATLAASRYPSGSPQAEFAGQLQGAAIAPISDLEYGTSWLQPKILLNCTVAFLGREQFISSENMPDGTSWKLECRRPAEPAFADLELSLAIDTQQCQNPNQ